MEKYARQTRNAAVTIAVVVCISAVLSIIGGIYAVVQLHTIAAPVSTSAVSSNCLSQGGYDPSC